uniref:Uncharacterized protein n=1 Tax=Opuntia streptacantha TaxID=393608 RepID=A0A7C9AF65_OPUST
MEGICGGGVPLFSFFYFFSTIMAPKAKHTSFNQHQKPHKQPKTNHKAPQLANPNWATQPIETPKLKVDATSFCSCSSTAEMPTSSSTKLLRECNNNRSLVCVCLLFKK